MRQVTRCKTQRTHRQLQLPSSRLRMARPCRQRCSMLLPLSEPARLLPLGVVKKVRLHAHDYCMALGRRLTAPEDPRGAWSWQLALPRLEQRMLVRCSA